MAGLGGAEGYILGVRDGLRAAGDEVALLTSSAGSAANGTAEYRAYGTDRTAANAVLQLLNPFAMASLRHALRSFRPDVALVNMFEYHLSPAILGQLRTIPTVFSVTDYKPVCPIGSKLLPTGELCQELAGRVCWNSGCLSFPHWLRDQARYAMIRAGRRHFNRTIACSQWVQRVLSMNGIAAEHLTLSVSPPSPSFRRAPAGKPLFVYCGRLHRNKGVDLLLRAFASLRTELPAARLRIVGTGPDRPPLEQLAESLGLGAAVEFRGRVSPEEVEGQMADAWAVVIPSLWAEPLGLVALESTIRGIPVVASAAGGLGEIVRPGVGGLLFPNGDEAALLRHLLAVARGEAFPSRSVPGEEVQRVREEHSPERHIRRLRRIFDEIAPGSPTASEHLVTA